MKVGEVRQYTDKWHCGIYTTTNHSNQKEFCHINPSEPFLILLIDKIDFNDRFWIKVFFRDKVGFIIASDATTEIVV